MNVENDESCEKNDYLNHHRKNNNNNNNSSDNGIKRRKDVAAYLYNLWTNGGSDLSCLAPLLVNGIIDTITEYVLQLEQNDDDDDDTTTSNTTAINNDNNRTATKRTIDRVHYKDMTYNEFVTNYMQVDQPVIIQGLAETWKATTEWVDEFGKPNLNYIAEYFGSSIAPVVEQPGHGFNLTRQTTTHQMTVTEYRRWWERYHSDNVNNKCNISERKTAEEKEEKIGHRVENYIDVDESSDDTSLLYLKDWKFLAANPDYIAYEWPVYFQDDWLNDAMGNAYKFVYLGPAGTSTPLHADVIRSYSWSTNICGVKRWYLVPPSDMYWLYDTIVFGGHKLPTHLHIDVIYPGMQSFYPGLQYIRNNNSIIEVLQYPGETIFVPTNWFHTVENIQPTVSINHNWLNSYNIRTCWDHIESELRSLKKSNTSNRTIHNDSTTMNNSDVETKCIDTIANNSPVDDDVLLMWHIVSKKANEVLQKYGNDRKSVLPVNRQTIMDCNAMIYVVNGFQTILRENLSFSVTKEISWNILEKLHNALSNLIDSYNQ